MASVGRVCLQAWSDASIERFDVSGVGSEPDAGCAVVRFSANQGRDAQPWWELAIRRLLLSLDRIRVEAAPERITGVLLGAFALVLPILASFPTSQILATVLILAGIVLVIVFRRRPQMLIAILAVLAWASRPTLQILDVNIRVEQPILGILFVIVLVKYRDTAITIIRTAWPMAAGLALWLAADFTSSLLVAPNPALSLRIVVWLAMSIGAAWIVSVLVMQTDRHWDIRQVLIVAGVAQVSVALMALVTGLLFGTSWGGYVVQDGVASFRAYGLAWEPNIFASGLAIIVPIAVDRFRERGRLVDLAACAFLALGVGMSLTRAVWIALLIGLVLYIVLLMVTSPEVQRLRRSASAAAVGTVMMGLVLGAGLTVAATGASDPLVAQLARLSIFSAAPTPIAPTPTVPTPVATPPGSSDQPPDIVSTMTLSFRLERVREAFDDLRVSPIIGLGANSFGQRHLHPGTVQADYLAVFPITVVYDAGILGLGGLSMFAVLFVRMLWRSGRRRQMVPFLASLIVMLVAYMSTDALRFSQNWILMGVALGLVLRPHIRQGDVPE